MHEENDGLPSVNQASSMQQAVPAEFHPVAAGVLGLQGYSNPNGQSPSTWQKTQPNQVYQKYLAGQ